MSQGISTTEQPPKKFRITYTGVFLAVILACGLLTGIAPKTVVAILVLAASVGLFFTGQIHMAFPIMVFYYSAFGNFMGMSVYRYYSLLLLAFVLIKKGSTGLKKWQVAPLLIFVVYVFCVIFPDNLRRGVFVLVDIVCVMLLINGYLKDEDGLKQFFRIYVYAALCAYVTGQVNQASMGGVEVIGGELMEVKRNIATFEDPNYAGLFYSVAVFATMSLRLFRPKLRAIIVIALTVVIITTMSISALLINVILWIVYLFAFRKIKLATFLCGVLILVVLLGLYQYGLQNPDTPVIGVFSYRILDKLQALESNDINAVTTNRTGLTKRHLDYFSNQSLFRMLVGMNAASSLKVDLNGLIAAAHNEYVDLLLNVGILGTLIYLGLFLSRTWQCFMVTRKTQDPYSGCIFMIKMVWALYGLTLTMFGDYRFMMLFLM